MEFIAPIFLVLLLIAVIIFYRQKVANLEILRKRSDSDRKAVIDFINRFASTVSTVEEIDNRTPQEIIAEIEQLDVQAARALQAIKELL